MPGRRPSDRRAGRALLGAALAPSVVVVLLLLGASPLPGGTRRDPETTTKPAAAADAATPRCAKIWLGREAEFEEMLRRAKVTRMEDIGVGVLESQCAYVEEGLPFERMCWKTVKKKRKAGFWEDYKSEIAAYELDKLLGLGMVPPTVERHLGGTEGSVMLWLEEVNTWDMDHPVRGPDDRAWARELVREKMFDRLIGNIDRNQGNLFYDQDWCLLLIDHSRAFIDVTDRRQFQETRFYDLTLWAKMKALDLETLRPALGEWISTGMMRAMLQRRDQMAREIDELAKTRGGNIWLR